MTRRTSLDALRICSFDTLPTGSGARDQDKVTVGGLLVFSRDKRGRAGGGNEGLARLVWLGQCFREKYSTAKVTIMSGHSVWTGGYCVAME